MSEHDTIQADLGMIWHQQMSAGDRSTLFGNLSECAKGHDTSSMTSRGSPCDAFWSRLCVAGSAVAKPELVKDVPGDLFRAFAFTPEGARHTAKTIEHILAEEAS